MTEFLQRDFAHQSFFDLCIHEKQRLRQALNPLSNLLLTKIQLCWDRPNISGTMPFPVSRSWDGTAVVAGGNGVVNGTVPIPFDFYGNAIYGASTTVQPFSVLLTPCVRF